MVWQKQHFEVLKKKPNSRKAYAFHSEVWLRHTLDAPFTHRGLRHTPLWVFVSQVAMLEKKIKIEDINILTQKSHREWVRIENKEENERKILTLDPKKCLPHNRGFSFRRHPLTPTTPYLLCLNSRRLLRLVSSLSPSSFLLSSLSAPSPPQLVFCFFNLFFFFSWAIPR